MRARRSAVVVLVGIGFWAVLPGAAAQAHPLGNFTVNHYDHVQLFPDRVEVTAVVDRAEIPAAQALQTIAPDGSPSTEQLAAAAAAECADLSAAARLAVDGSPADWVVAGSTMETVPGAAGLPTLRLTCELRSAAELGAAAEVAFEDTYLPDRLGWREVTADGTGVRLVDSPVPVVSISDALRSYPDDLLSSPVDVRSFTVATEPGENTGAGAAITPGPGDPFSSALAQLDRWLEGLIGSRELTPLVGILAVLLALLLGSGHALLPGHGKSVMAAYLAGRRGRPRDAFTVGATVTATHTAGVLALGLALSLSSALAGDQVIRWLGVLSGLLVAGIGAFMLRAALRARRPARKPQSPAVEPIPEPVLVAALPAAGAGGAVHGHHHHGHDHGHGYDRDHHHDHDHHHDGPTGRGGLIGMGVAGGLVPSPSALIVLLASVGLGRTGFGVALVLAYGLGMAATLTAVGLLLVHVRGRLDRRLTDPRSPRWPAGLTAAIPVGTAGLVLLVGLTLATRGVVLGA